MPFIKIDPGMYDEIAAELDPADLPDQRPSGRFEYETAQAKFKPEKLGPVARTLFDAVTAAGATAFRVKYDGGYDEGFSHPDAILFGQRQRSVAEVVRELAEEKLIARIRKAAGKDSMWGNASEFYANASDKKVVEYALDELAHELASRLLGDGFGTGEYQLYGAFTADFKSGKILDHADAAKPSEMD